METKKWMGLSIIDGIMYASDGENIYKQKSGEDSIWELCKPAKEEQKKPEIINQIRSIGGVKTVEMAGEGICVVEFWAEKKNLTQSEIIEEAIKRGFVKGVKHRGVSGLCEFEITDDLHFYGGSLYGGQAGCIYDGNTWAKIVKPQKPKSLKPEELVDGGIYALAQYPEITTLFRFHNIGIYSDTSRINVIHGYSFFTDKCFCEQGNYAFDDTSLHCRPATLPEKQTLIKAEIENGFYYELKNQK